MAIVDWARSGVPERPGAWITVTARRRAIDRLRRDRVLADRVQRLGVLAEREAETVDEEPEPSAVADDRLRLLFTCCHPALALEARVALTLRTLGGLTTEQIARAFLVSDAAMYQRLVRAKRKIAVARIPYRVPARRGAARAPGRRARRPVPDLQRGLERVGRAAARARRAVRRGDRPDADAAARLMPDEAEVHGPAGADAAARLAPRGARGRSAGRWCCWRTRTGRGGTAGASARASALLEAALARGVAGPYLLQAAIAALPRHRAVGGRDRLRPDRRAVRACWPRWRRHRSSRSTAPSRPGRARRRARPAWPLLRAGAGRRRPGRLRAAARRARRPARTAPATRPAPRRRWARAAACADNDVARRALELRSAGTSARPRPSGTRARRR